MVSQFSSAATGRRFRDRRISAVCCVAGPSLSPPPPRRNERVLEVYSFARCGVSYVAKKERKKGTDSQRSTSFFSSTGCDRIENGERRKRGPKEKSFSRNFSRRKFSFNTWRPTNVCIRDLSVPCKYLSRALHGISRKQIGTILGEMKR